jgi:diacylglycerol kinase (ATP)
MFKETQKKKGLARILAACWYSAYGLQAAFQNEAAFRQEVFLYFVFLPVLYYLPVSDVFKAVLLLANTLILIVELLNSAIESIVDLVSPEYHVLAKQAKDMGSAAVMVSVFFALLLWSYALFSLF